GPSVSGSARIRFRLYSYALYERISERCLRPSGGPNPSGYPRGDNPTTLASSGMRSAALTFSSLKAKTQEVPSPSLVAAKLRWESAMPTSTGYEFMYPPTVATASSSRAHATMRIGASGSRFAFVHAAETSRLASSSVTTMNFQG